MAENTDRDIKNANAITDIQRLLHRVASRVSRIVSAHGNFAKSDPDREKARLTSDLSRLRGIPLRGRIYEAIPYTQCYFVLPEGARCPIVCNLLHRGAAGLVGVQDHSTLPVGTDVWYLQSTNGWIGTIIGAVPIAYSDPRISRSDMIVAGYPSLIQHSKFERLFTLDNNSLNIHDWSTNTPIDSSTAGELNYTAETGMMLHLDAYMGALKLNEMTGLFLHYWDSLCRLAGSNLQIWSAGSVFESIDDEGELQIYEGYCVYPWEQKGLLCGSDDEFPGGKLNDLSVVGDERTPEQCQEEEPHYSRFEPHTDTIVPFHRLRTYRGFLGSAEKRILAIPNYSAGNKTHDTAVEYAKPGPYLGVFEENLAMNGHWSVRSAAGITLAKQPIIPVPRQIAAPADKTGDSVEEGYVPSNEGTHPPSWTTLLPGNPGSYETMIRVMDIHAHLFNWRGLHTFHYHDKDFSVPQENDYQSPWTTQTPMATGFELADVRVDHRHTMQTYLNTSHLSLFDDGTVSIGDGFGSVIRMYGGNIQMACSKNILLQSGGTTAILSVGNLYLHAKEEAEILSTDKSVRIKAQESFNVVAGLTDEDTDGIWLEVGTDADLMEETNTYRTAGINLLARRSRIQATADNIGLCANKRVSSSDGSVGDDGDTGIIACRADTVIRNYAPVVADFVTCAAYHHVNIGDYPVMYFFSDHANFTSKAQSDLAPPNLLVNGSIVARVRSYAEAFVDGLYEDGDVFNFSEFATVISDWSDAIPDLSDICVNGYLIFTYATGSMEIPEPQYMTEMRAMGMGSGWNEVELAGDYPFPVSSDSSGTMQVKATTLVNFNTATGKTNDRPHTTSWNAAFDTEYLI